MTIAKNHPISQPLLINVSNTTFHSAEQLERLKSDNPDLHIELTAEGQLVVGEIGVAAFETEASPSLDRKSVSGFTPQTQSPKVLNFSEMTLQERVDAIENHKKHRQEIIDALTPEELEISNQQFEHMFKQLAESRNYNC
jgi:hypothetical protein